MKVNRKIGVAIAAPLTLTAIFLLFTLSKANRTLKSAESEIAHQNQIPFHIISLDRPLPAGFESISSPAKFLDAAIFRGRFYLAGPSGLSAYDTKGSLAARYRPGLELPPAPLVAVAADAQNLWISTAGEGLLIFDGHRFSQIRPDDPSPRQLTSILPLASGRILSDPKKTASWSGTAEVSIAITPLSQICKSRA